MTRKTAAGRSPNGSSGVPHDGRPATVRPVDGASVGRVRSEFLEMPGLSLTLEQAQRLFALERGVCESILHALLTEGVLRKAGSHYRRGGGA